jgi:hypothetical protein
MEPEGLVGPFLRGPLRGTRGGEAHRSPGCGVMEEVLPRQASNAVLPALDFGAVELDARLTRAVGLGSTTAMRSGPHHTK